MCDQSCTASAVAPFSSAVLGYSAARPLLISSDYPSDTLFMTLILLIFFRISVLIYFRIFFGWASFNGSFPSRVLKLQPNGDLSHSSMSGHHPPPRPPLNHRPLHSRSSADPLWSRTTWQILSKITVSPLPGCAAHPSPLPHFCSLRVNILPLRGPSAQFLLETHILHNPEAHGCEWDSSSLSAGPIGSRTLFYAPSTYSDSEDKCALRSWKGGRPAQGIQRAESSSSPNTMLCMLMIIMLYQMVMSHSKVQWY